MRLLDSAMVAVLLASGCSVGKGVGAASGEIFEYGCSKNGDYCASDADGGVCGPLSYDLRPAFFSGEPIDDLRQYSEGSNNMIMNNRLTIRLQRSGKRIEQNDVLTFDVASSYEVARCVRGHVLPDGTKDWDEANCYRATDKSPGRIRLQWDSPVHASRVEPRSATQLQRDAESHGHGWQLVVVGRVPGIWHCRAIRPGADRSRSCQRKVPHRARQSHLCADVLGDVGGRRNRHGCAQ